MLKKIGLGILVILAGFLGYVALQPSEYVISREITINAPAEKIFPYLNSTKLADQWGPWREVDQDAQFSNSGPDEGVGSRSSWENGKRLGTGSATIIESIPNQKVGVRLEYTQPMSMSQHSEYLLQSVGEQTVMTWKVTGKNNFMGRFMCVFGNMDKMVGGLFEKGLSNLKTLVEKKS